MSRSSKPSRRWLLRWTREHVAAGGWGGPATLQALAPRAVELYAAGASARVAGLATARESASRASATSWRELGTAFLESHAA